MTKSHSLFFYGTLMSPAVLYRVIYGLTISPPSSSLKIRSAILKNHERHRVLHVDYPGVIPRAGSSVLGTLVQNLTPADVIRLDAFEGDEYERRDVIVEVDGEEVSAATYIWIAGEERLEKGEWNFEEFCREKLGRWTGESVEFEESDKVATGGRSVWNGETIRSAV